jgi:hypothetical protein
MNDNIFNITYIMTLFLLRSLKSVFSNTEGLFSNTDGLDAPANSSENLFLFTLDFSNN